MCTDDLVESTYWQFFWEEGLSGISHSSVSTSSIRQSGETFYLHQKRGDFWVISLEAKRKSCKLLYWIKFIHQCTEMHHAWVQVLQCVQSLLFRLVQTLFHCMTNTWNSGDGREWVQLTRDGRIESCDK